MPEPREATAEELARIGAEATTSRYNVLTAFEVARTSETFRKLVGEMAENQNNSAALESSSPKRERTR